MFQTIFLSNGAEPQNHLADYNEYFTRSWNSICSAVLGFIMLFKV